MAAKIKRTKKTIPPNTRKKSVAAKKTPVLEKNPPAGGPMMPITPSAQKSMMPRAVKVIIAIVILLALFGFIFRSWFVVAIVNGQPITRLAFDQELEVQGGQQVLSAMITKQLIAQAMQKDHITVSQKEVDIALQGIDNDIKKQGGTLDQMLATQGETKANFVERLQIQLMAQKLFSKDIQVSDKEIADVLNNPDQKSALQITDSMTPDQQKAAVKKQLQQQKLSSKFQSWIADLQRNAKVTKFVNY